MEMRWTGYVALMWDIRIVYKVFVKKAEERDYST
jgi:hypothetical protein